MAGNGDNYFAHMLQSSLRMHKLPSRMNIALVLSALAVLAGAMSAGAAEKFVVLVSSNDAPFQKALDGFRAAMAGQQIGLDYEVLKLGGDAAKANTAAQRIKSNNARLVVAMGSLATDAVLREASAVPLVSCMALRTEHLNNAPNATGVGLEFPFEVQFQWLQRLLPDATTIGVLYNPAENQKRIKAAAAAAKKAGLKLEAYEVNAPQDVPAALDSLSRRADVLWGLADNLVLSQPIVKNLLLFSFRNNIPLIGPSETWVKAGALYSLDWDFTDLGAQCGEMTQKVIAGAPPNTLPPASPRTVLYSLNLLTARKMRIELPEQVVRGAHQTY